MVNRVGDLVRFMSLRTNSAKRPMNDTLCYQFFANTKQTWLISFFFKSGIEYIHENP